MKMITLKQKSHSFFYKLFTAKTCHESDEIISIWDMNWHESKHLREQKQAENLKAYEYYIKMNFSKKILK